jgi:hypothetical protein
MSATGRKTTIRFQSNAEQEMFRSAAKSEGFTTLQAWIMYHLRRQAKQTLRIKLDGNSRTP